MTVDSVCHVYNIIICTIISCLQKYHCIIASSFSFKFMANALCYTSFKKQTECDCGQSVYLSICLCRSVCPCPYVSSIMSDRTIDRRLLAYKSTFGSDLLQVWP